jgi:hypothetical protein
MNKEIQQFRSALMNTGRGFTSSASSSLMSESDYGRLIRQEQDEIIELVHAYNNSKKARTGFSSSGSGKDTSKIEIAKFRQLLFE